MTNCPNCGAPITGPVCEYCDTRFDLPDITTLKIKAGSLKIAMRIEELCSDAIKVLDLMAQKGEDYEYDNNER